MPKETESTSSESTSSESTSYESTVSLLDRLKAPTQSELSRKHCVYTNPPPNKGKQRSSCRGYCDLKSGHNGEDNCKIIRNKGIA